MKKIKCLALLCIYLVCTVSYGMKRKFEDPKQQVQNSNKQHQYNKPLVNKPLVEAFLTSQDGDIIKQKILLLFNRAMESVLVVMYWVTDDDIINKLIDLKKRGVSIQVVYDSSSPKSVETMEKLLKNNITPLIFPSYISSIGLMHHKFVVIDRNIVLTGSANFSSTGLYSNGQRFNFENMLVLRSRDIALKYVQQLPNIERIIINQYIKIVANNSDKDIEPWLRKVGPMLFKERLLFPIMLNHTKSNFNEEQQDRLDKFFGIEKKIGDTQNENK